MEKEEIVNQIIVLTKSLQERQKNQNDEDKQRVKIGNSYAVLISGFIVLCVVLKLAASTVGIKNMPVAAKGALVVFILLMAIPIYKIVKSSKNPYAELKKENEERKNQAYSIKQVLNQEDEKTIETIYSFLNNGMNPNSLKKMFKEEHVKWVLRTDSSPSFFCAALSGTNHEYYVAGPISTAIWVDVLPFRFKTVEGMMFDYTPSKIMVGGAISGGVAVGGAFDAGNFMTSSRYDTDRCELILTICGIDFSIDAVDVQPVFLHDEDYSYGFDGFEVIEPSRVILKHDSPNLGINYRSNLAVDPGVSLSMMSRAVAETHLTGAEARDLVETLYMIARSGRIMHD